MDVDVAPESGEDGEAKFDPRIVLRVLRRRYRLILGISFLAVGIGAAWVAQVTPIYEASARLLIESRSPAVLTDVQEVYQESGGWWASREYLKTQIDIISSRPVAERVVDSLGLIQGELTAGLEAQTPAANADDSSAQETLMGLPEQLRQRLALLGFAESTPRADALAAVRGTDTVARVRGMLEVLHLPDTRFVDIKIMHTHPKAAAQLANGFVDAYVAYDLSRRRSVGTAAVEWLADQVTILKDKLTQAELQLYEFKKGNNIISVSLQDRQSMLSEELSALYQDLTHVRGELLLLANRREQVQRLRQEGKSLYAVPDIGDSGLITSLRADEVAMRREVSGLLIRYTENHPQVKEINSRLAAVHAEIAREVARIVEDLDERYVAKHALSQRLVEEIERAKNEVLGLNKKEIQYDRLRRERDNTEELYKMVLKRHKEADLTTMLKAQNIQKFARAEVPEAPVIPHKRRTLALALVLGVICGLGLAFVMERFDSSLSTPDEVQRELQLPFLGVLPQLVGSRGSAKMAESECDLHTINAPRSRFAEYCRTIRTNIMFMAAGEDVQALLVTSATGEEGKSTTAANLGQAMALSGGRVLLVDADLRRPRLHRSFGLSISHGLSSLLTRTCLLADAVQHTSIEEMDILPCGPIPPNPVELLHGAAFKELLAELRSRYDKIIFDSPPVNAVADSLVLASVLDGIVLVLRSGETQLHTVRLAKTRLKAVGGRLLGIVLNRYDPKSETEADGYYYYYDQDESRRKAPPKHATYSSGSRHV